MASEILANFQRQIGAVDDGLWGKGTLIAATRYFKFSPEEAAHFFGQCAVESGGFTLFVENLNYSSKRLLEVFPKYFNVTTAKQYANIPRKIASRVYANRMGNGSEASEDGWKYRGRGAIQLTGKSAYKDFASWANNMKIYTEPETILTNYVFVSAQWFFEKNGLFNLAKQGVTDATIEAITRKINGGYNGLITRKKKTYEYYKILK